MPSSSPETALPSASFEGLNICRVAALSMMFSGNQESIREVASELRSIGLSDELAAGQRMWPPIGDIEYFPHLNEQGYGEEGRNRVQLWQQLNEEPYPQNAISFIVAVLGSELERESAGAAAALWRATREVSVLRPAPPRGYLLDWWAFLLDFLRPYHGTLWEPFAWPYPGIMSSEPGDDDFSEVNWDSEGWQESYNLAMRAGAPHILAILLIRTLARGRLESALRSPDAITRSLARTVLLPIETTEEELTTTSRPESLPPTEQMVSTMVHGTHGWMSDWWRPGSDFHEFIHQYRPNLYGRGGKYGWSGEYRRRAREMAAKDLCKWASTEAESGLQTVLAHSYGGEVAARALLAGVPLGELILLSSPVTPPVVESAATLGTGLVDIRLPFDAVLALARTRQRIPGIAPLLLKRWRLDHGATHERHIWMEEELADRVLH